MSTYVCTAVVFRLPWWAKFCMKEILQEDYRYFVVLSVVCYTQIRQSTIGIIAYFTLNSTLVMTFPYLLTQLHPATVHFPIALLSLASSAGLLYLYWQARPALVVLTWWPMFLGWLGATVAILTGLLAQSGLPPTAPYRTVLNWHISTGLALFVVYGVLLYQRWVYNSVRVRKARTRRGIDSRELLEDARAKGWLSLLLLIGLVLIVASGWNGGKLVYEWGVNVAP